MSDGAVFVAKCWRCGWESPSVASEGSAEAWCGFHAIRAGCPIGEVRTLRTSEVSVS